MTEILTQERFKRLDRELEALRSTCKWQNKIVVERNREIELLKLKIHRMKEKRK